VDKIQKLVVVGDSWTYGSEIRDPVLPEEVKDWYEPNDHYRLPRIWPTKLGNMIGAEQVVNLSYPAASNDRSVRHLVGWLTEHYLKPGKDTSELFVVVGLTSPERRDFYYKGSEGDWWFTLWPMWKHLYPQAEINALAEPYIKNFYNPKEYIHRYITQIFYLQNIFKQYNIKHVFFQAFYQYENVQIINWLDAPYMRDYGGQPDQYIWDMIDPVRFMHKDTSPHSFHNYIVNKAKEENTGSPFLIMHPNETAHTWWAEHIYQYCTENNLW
jgi:hypothetical protein